MHIHFILYFHPVISRVSVQVNMKYQSLFIFLPVVGWFWGSSEMISIWISEVEWFSYCIKYTRQVGSDWSLGTFLSIEMLECAEDYKPKTTERGWTRFSRVQIPFLLLLFPLSKLNTNYFLEFSKTNVLYSPFELI